jgi:hypothetical protein
LIWHAISFSSKKKKTFVRGSAFNEQDGGAVHNFIWQRKSGIPHKPLFRFFFSQTEQERQTRASKNSFPPNPLSFCPPA